MTSGGLDETGAAPPTGETLGDDFDSDARNQSSSLPATETEDHSGADDDMARPPDAALMSGPAGDTPGLRSKGVVHDSHRYRQGQGRCRPVAAQTTADLKGAAL